MNGNQFLFDVESTADLGIRRVVLEEERYYHIVDGHRDLRSCGLSLIQETATNPTHVYKSAYDCKRYQFVSNQVTSKSGRPMNVIVEMGKAYGEIITATLKDKINGIVVWDAGTDLYASYDKKSDVLYFSKGDCRSSYAIDDEEDERIWLRRHEDDNSAAGVTIFQAKSLAATRCDLPTFIAHFLSASPDDVAVRLHSLVK